jgi:hypothetical protein
LHERGVTQLIIDTINGTAKRKEWADERVLENALHCLSSFTSEKEIRSKLDRSELISTLLKMIRSENENIKYYAAMILENFMDSYDKRLKKEGLSDQLGRIIKHGNARFSPKSGVLENLWRNISFLVLVIACACAVLYKMW